MTVSLYRILLFIAFWFLLPGLVALEPRSDELIKVRIIYNTQTVTPDSEIWVGLQVSLAPNWHIYWKNAGGSGYPTTLKWNLPSGWKADPLEFPAPYLYEFEGMYGYALENNFTMLARLHAPSIIEEKTEIQATLDALVCNQTNCLPYEYSFSLHFSRSDMPQLIRKNLSILDEARDILPSKITADFFTRATLAGNKGKLMIQSSFFSGLSGNKFSFFPENPLIMTGHSDIQFSNKSSTLEINWKLAQDDVTIPDVIVGVLTHPKLPHPRIISVPIDMIPSMSGSSTPLVEENMVKKEFSLITILLGFVLVAMAAWAYGKSSESKVRAGNWRILAVVCFVGGIWLGYPVATDQEELKWETWSEERQNELLANGFPVFIDYTAKWCLSCQVNKRVYLNESVRDALIDNEVHLLRADWTKKSPAILKSLQSHSREGVPFNIYYPPTEVGISRDPVIFPEILSTQMLSEAIHQGLLVEQESEKNHFFAMLGFAWLGGLILNLMPCVFPVIGLKIMGFVKHAGEDRKLISQHGWIFTLGVVLSFWVLVGILLFLRDGLERQLGWGFQLQEPVFVLVLAVLLFLFALSLSGVFEIGMSLTRVGSGLSQKSGLWGSFFSGALATVVATPCMAPFLGVAVGAALTMSILPSLAIFTCIALGLSTPYLLLCFFPQWLEKLPKPGAWMNSFKQFMAFPIYATVAWLIWTFVGLL